MSMELIALIGISVTVITIGVALAALILNTQRNLQADMRTEFKAVRADIQALREETKTEFKAVRAEMQALREETKTEFKAVRAEMQALREEKTEFTDASPAGETDRVQGLACGDASPAGRNKDRIQGLACGQMQAQREETKTGFKTQREETKTGFKTQWEAIISLLERMAHLEGLLDGLREAITGRRVAEEAGKYDPR